MREHKIEEEDEHSRGLILFPLGISVSSTEV